MNRSGSGHIVMKNLRWLGVARDCIEDLSVLLLAAETRDSAEVRQWHVTHLFPLPIENRDLVMGVHHRLNDEPFTDVLDRLEHRI